jgi:hypothetical protein
MPAREEKDVTIAECSRAVAWMKRSFAKIRFYRKKRAGQSLGRFSTILPMSSEDFQAVPFATIRLISIG